ncbi:hypothetical protein [Nostoc sp.]|uniref:hypothetical protein n=1 Tax=Nostoc sp. TaxID=1180 RepID=UPI002FFD13E5
MGIGNWELGIGHWALGIGNWELISYAQVTENRRRKAVSQSGGWQYFSLCAFLTRNRVWGKG